MRFYAKFNSFSLKIVMRPVTTPYQHLKLEPKVTHFQNTNSVDSNFSWFEDTYCH